MNIASRDSVSAEKRDKTPRKWRRMFQFRIRTLLIAMLILPIGLSWFAKRVRDSQIAWNHYRAVHGYIEPRYYIDHRNVAVAKTRQPSWLSRLGMDLPPVDDHFSIKFRLEDNRKQILEHVTFFESLTSLSIRCYDISNEDILLLQKLKNLQKFKLSLDRIDRDGINEVAKLSNLRSFALRLPSRSNNKVVCDLSFLAELPLLESLDLDFGVPIGNDGLEAISKAQGLKELRLDRVAPHYANGSPYAKDLLRNGRLHRNDLADEGLLHLAKIPSLETLELRSTNFTEKGMQAIGTLSRLETLWIDSQLLGDEDLQYLKPLQNLKSLTLNCHQLSGQSLPHLAALPNLRSLAMVVRSVEVKDLQQIAKMTQLQTLTLHEVQTDNDLVQAINGMSGLQRLRLASTNLTDEQLLQLIETPGLTELVIIDSLVTPAGEKAAREKRPNLDINIVVRSSGIMN